MKSGKITVIGAGNMGEALIRGISKAKGTSSVTFLRPERTAPSS